MHGCQRVAVGFWVTSPKDLPSISVLRPMPGPVPTVGWFESPIYPAEMMAYCKCQAASGVEGMLPEELQAYFWWQECLGDPTRWWDTRHSLNVPFGLHNRHKPAWVDSQLTQWDAGMETHLESLFPSVQSQGAIRRLGAHEGPVENGMCRKLCEEGRISDAVDALNLLVQQGCHLDKNTYYRALRMCIAHKDLVIGRRIHALTAKSGYEGDAFLSTQLIRLYASHGKLEEAMQVLSRVCAPDAYNWATIIFAYGRHGEAAHAIRLYRQMLESTTVQPSNHVYVAVLKACATVGDLVAGKEVHAHILANHGMPDIFVHTGLISMYAKCGSLGDARRVFDRTPERNVVAWTAMFAGYAQQGMGEEALCLYSTMQHEGFTSPNAVTFVCLLQACASVGADAMDQGKLLHSQIQERGLQEDLVLGGSLVNMYAKCGSLEDARCVFDRLPHRNVIAWNAMLAGYAQQGLHHKVVSLFTSVHQEGLTSPDAVTYVCLLQSCASVGVGALDQGKQLHSQIQERRLQEDSILGVGLVNMYAKCGSIGDACRVFDRLQERNVVAWTVMLAGYVQHGMGQEALSLYSSMQQEGLTPPDSGTYLCLLQACASVGVGALDQGKQLHSQILERGLHEDLVLGGSLVNMYAKCGSLDDARQVFERLPERDVGVWTAMLAGYAQQGMGQEALSLYSCMQQEDLTPPNAVTFVCLLQACACVGVRALDQGKQIHSQIQERGMQEDPVMGGSLVNMYAKCGSLEDSRWVFDRLPERNVIAWNAMFAGYTQQRMGKEALSLYLSMQDEGLTSPDCVTYVCLLQACASVGVGALEEGKELHSRIQIRGLQEDLVLGATLVNMYAKCGSLVDARWVFDRLPGKNVVAWNAMLAGYAQQGLGQEALGLYPSMQQGAITLPNSVTFVCLLQACASEGVGALDHGKQFHSQIEECGLLEDLALGGSLVNMYAKCGSLQDAYQVFKNLPGRNVVTWNSMLAGYAQQGMVQAALRLYTIMQQEGLTTPNSVTFVCLLQACASVGVGALSQGKCIHSQIQERGLQLDLVLGGSLVNMYAKCGSLEDARWVFDRLPERDVVSWNAMLAGYAQHGMGKEALNLFSSMQQENLTTPDSVTLVFILQACAVVGVGALDQGKQHHSQIQERGLQEDLVLGGSLVNMYAKCGKLEDARQMFDSLVEKNVVAWNAMLAGYVQQGMGQEALILYGRMQQDSLTTPDSVTYLCLLQACASIGVGALDQGKQFHSQIDEHGLQEDLVLGSTLVTMYAKCGSLRDARQVFDGLPARDVVAWTAMLAAYAQQGMGQEAITLYTSMQQEGVTPDTATFVCLLQASASVAALPLGKQLHAQIEEQGLHTDVIVGATLVNMYAKCGSMIDSQQVFDSLPERTIEAWSALIDGYGRQGDSEVVFDLVERMKLEDIQPDGITLLCVLTVCSHVGEVDKGRKFFEALKLDYGICPTIEHYTCMVDLLSRAGLLDEALHLAKTMPFPPTSAVGHTLLGACRKWNNVEIAQQAFEFAVSVDVEDTSSYVLMSNIYASAQMWKEAQELQVRRKEFEGWKELGQSWWTDMGGGVHMFVAGEKEHPQLKYAKKKPESEAHL